MYGAFSTLKKNLKKNKLPVCKFGLVPQESIRQIHCCLVGVLG